MKNFNKYVAIAITIRMHMRCDYMDVLLQNTYLSDIRIQGYRIVLQPKLSLKTHFHARFNNHVTSHVTQKVDE